MRKSDFIVYPFEFDFIVVNKETNKVVKMPTKPSWDGIPVTANSLKALYVSMSLENYGHKHTKDVEKWWDSYTKGAENE